MSENATNNSTAGFESALTQNTEAYYCLRLYIAGISVRSLNAIEQLNRICEKFLPGRYTLEVIDVYQQPELAKPEQILAIPTLIKTLPLPLRRIVGDMTKTEKVLVGLDIISNSKSGI